MDAVLPQQIWDWNYRAIIDPHLGNLAYGVARPTVSARSTSTAYESVKTLWRNLSSGRAREFGRIALKGFSVFDYVPRAPGLYHDYDAGRAREEAFRYLDGRLGQSPAEIDAAAARDYRVVFAPQGKQSMLDGGVGCVRLKPIVAGSEVLMLMSATSGNQAHSGFPIAVPEDRYAAIIEPILADGVVVCDLEGQLHSVPHELYDLFGHSRGIPRVYLRVDDLRIRGDLPPPANPRVSVAVSFTSDYERRNGIYATYVTFTPGDNPTFDRALGWLDEVYVKGGYEGRIITDFDQSRSWFPSAALSLRAIMSRKRNQLDAEVLELMHARAQVDQLFDALERDEFISSLGGRARSKVFISYSHRDSEVLESLSEHLRRVPDVQVSVWDDRQIDPGTRWRNSIFREIGTSKAALLLVSQDFLDSDFIQHAELPRLLEDEEGDGLQVFVLYLERCNLTAAPYLSRLQGINAPDAPLFEMTAEERDRALSRAVAVVREVFENGS